MNFEVPSRSEAIYLPIINDPEGGGKSPSSPGVYSPSLETGPDIFRITSPLPSALSAMDTHDIVHDDNVHRLAPPARVSLLSYPTQKNTTPPTKTHTPYVWYIRLLMLTLTIAVLHFTFHLPHAACDIILFVTHRILLAIHALESHRTIPTTLRTVIKNLDLSDRFYVIPQCESCHRLFPSTINHPRTMECPSYSIPISSAFINKASSTRSPALPPNPKHSSWLLVARFHISPSPILLASFLSVTERSKRWTHGEGRKGSQMSRVTSWIGVSGRPCERWPFFRPDIELRSSLTMGLDW